MRAPRKTPATIVVRPEIAWFRLNGRPCRLTYWTAEQWASLPRRDRPRGTSAGSRGGRFMIEPEPPLSPSAGPSAPA
jgi:hypothetical protein